MSILAKTQVRSLWGILLFLVEICPGIEFETGCDKVALGGSAMSFSSSQTVTLAGVGNTLTEVEVSPIPTTGRLERVRAIVSAGTAINQVSVEVRDATGATGLGVLFSTGGLVANPLDQSPLDWFSIPSAGGGAIHGSLFVAASVDNAALDHTIDVELIFENLVS